MAIFVGDALTDADITVSLLYVVIVLLSARFCDARQVVFVAMGCVALTVLANFLIEPLAVNWVPGVVDTLISIAGITLTAVLVVRDQTRERAKIEISRLNEQLAKQAKELEASNKELEAFAFSVSHDMRAPLRHVIAYAELLQRQAASLDDTGQRYTRTILEAAKKMGRLIDDLLAFSRIGRAEKRMTQVSLDQIVQEAVAEACQEAKGRDIAWKISPLPVCFGDPAMLRVAICNLISNAIKFTRQRERAEIEIGSTNGTANEVELFVKDNGAGFDMRYVSKLFGVFQRLHLAEEFEGTGIGLATVRRIIHRHGGQVRAEGQVDHGATFYVSLPRAQTTPDEAKRAGGVS